MLVVKLYAYSLSQLCNEAHKVPRITNSLLVIGEYEVVPDHEKLGYRVSQVETKESYNSHELPEREERQNQVLP